MLRFALQCSSHEPLPFGACATHEQAKLFQNRENSRDAFLSLARAFTTARQAMHPGVWTTHLEGFKASAQRFLGEVAAPNVRYVGCVYRHRLGKAQEVFTDAPSNRWFAQFFVEQLLRLGLEGGESAYDKELAALLQSKGAANQRRIGLLQSRMSRNILSIQTLAAAVSCRTRTSRLAVTSMVCTFP